MFAEILSCSLLIPFISFSFVPTRSASVAIMDCVSKALITAFASLLLSFPFLFPLLVFYCLEGIVGVGEGHIQCVFPCKVLGLVEVILEMPGLVFIFLSFFIADALFEPSDPVMDLGDIQHLNAFKNANDGCRKKSRDN